MRFLSGLLLVILLVYPALSSSIDGHSLWNIFTKLKFKDMQSYAAAYPHLLHDKNVRALLKCKVNFVCAFKKKHNTLVFREIPEHLHSHLIRQAAIGNNKYAVEELIRFGVDAKWLDYPLKRALQLGLDKQAQWMRSLLPRDMKSISIVKVDPNARKDELLLAAQLERLEYVQYSIAAGVDVNAKDEIGCTALMEAAEKGNLDIINVLLDAGADVNAKKRSGETALMSAVHSGRVDVVKALIAAGADVDHKNMESQTALLFATYSGYSEIAKVLIEAGADVNAFGGQSALTPLTAAIQNDNALSLLKMLIENGADLDTQFGYWGETALILTVKRQQSDAVKTLIDAGADVNVKDYIDRKALHYALAQDPIDSELVEVLKRASDKLLL